MPDMVQTAGYWLLAPQNTYWKKSMSEYGILSIFRRH
jgi:hypothetical protein